tara:strand:- start:103 stop:930 length:828 start_codon:yes stop_codon:yes gene_type:complete
MDVPAAVRPTGMKDAPGVQGVTQAMVDAESAQRFRPFDYAGVPPVLEGSAQMRVGLSGQTTHEYEIQAQQSNLNNQQRHPDGQLEQPLTAQSVIQQMVAAGVPAQQAQALIQANPGADPEVLLSMGLNPQDARQSVHNAGNKLRDLQNDALQYRAAVANVVRQGEAGPAGFVGGVTNGPLVQQGNAYLNALQQPAIPTTRAGGSINAYGGIAAYVPAGVADLFSGAPNITQNRSSTVAAIQQAQMNAIDPDAVPVEQIDPRFQPPYSGPQMPFRN